MARSRACRVCKNWHNLAEAWPVECLPHFSNVAVAAPNIRPDGMDAVRSHADGRTYESKSAYYASVKRAGCEIVGNDTSILAPKAEYRPQGVAADISRAIDQLRAR